MWRSRPRGCPWTCTRAPAAGARRSAARACARPHTRPCRSGASAARWRARAPYTCGHCSREALCFWSILTYMPLQRKALLAHKMPLSPWRLLCPTRLVYSISVSGALRRPPAPPAASMASTRRRRLRCRRSRSPPRRPSGSSCLPRGLHPCSGPSPCDELPSRHEARWSQPNSMYAVSWSDKN